jgi:uncharacterized membrane protein
MIYINNNTASKVDRYTRTHTKKKHIYCKLLRGENTRKVDEDANNAPSTRNI